MKLYATTTSERATKGQGGNELEIKVFDENRDELFKINVFKDSDNWYKVHFKSFDKNGLDFQELLREVKTKGNDRERRIKKFGLEIVENDEKIWKDRGYIINPKTGFLEQELKGKKKTGETQSEKFAESKNNGSM